LHTPIRIIIMNDIRIVNTFCALSVNRTCAWAARRADWRAVCMATILGYFGFLQTAWQPPSRLQACV